MWASTTGWPRLIACLKLQVIFRKRATNYRALLRKMTCEDNASYGSSPPCTKVSIFICVSYLIEILFLEIYHTNEDEKMKVLIFILYSLCGTFRYFLCGTFSRKRESRIYHTNEDEDFLLNLPHKEYPLNVPHKEYPLDVQHTRVYLCNMTHWRATRLIYVRHDSVICDMTQSV